MTASCSQWLLEPYGAPTFTSEVNCIPGFYCVEALTTFGPAATTLASVVSDAVSRTAEGVAEIVADIASTAAPGSARPAI